MKIRFLIGALVVGGLIIGGATLAQPMPGAGAAPQELMELQQRAQHLTMLAQLPEEARPEADALMARAEALRTAMTQTERERLQAYVTALEAGESVEAANEAADAQVEAARAELDTQQAQLLADIEAFREAHADSLGNLGAHFGVQFGAQFPGAAGAERPGQHGRMNMMGMRSGAPLGSFGPGGMRDMMQGQQFGNSGPSGMRDMMRGQRFGDAGPGGMMNGMQGHQGGQMHRGWPWMR